MLPYFGNTISPDDNTYFNNGIFAVRKIITPQKILRIYFILFFLSVYQPDPRIILEHRFCHDLVPGHKMILPESGIM